MRRQSLAASVAVPLAIAIYVPSVFSQSVRGTGAPPALAQAPFDGASARRHQETWAKHLGRPREIVNSIGMKLMLIPPGEFTMGSPDSEESRDPGEGPQHRVRILRPFYLGAYPVTQGEYRQVMGLNPSFFAVGGEGQEAVVGINTDRLPVENVSADDAQLFCRKLSATPAECSAGQVYGLPTEAQWEYACRAGTTTPFSFGTRLNGLEANCKGNCPYGTCQKGPYLERTTAVGSYLPNAFGLHDMHGNVAQWCADCYEEYFRLRRSDDPSGPVVGHRVLRGGAWDNEAEACRAAARGVSVPWYRNSIMGFRVALELKGDHEVQRRRAPGAVHR